MHTNRLAGSSSPYLLQHAHNPVDWWAWCDAAFDEAKRRDVPVLVSIGYSTCYWCHVMERESFENAQIARVMNDHLVCIKLDREQRPDIDDVYMSAVQALTGSGGWPLNVFLDPNTRKPFWGGTYFPPEPRYGRQGFDEIVGAMHRVWTTQRSEAVAQSEQLAAAVADRLGGAPTPVIIGEAQITEGVSSLLNMFDRKQGGFGQAPKFPQPVFLDLLIDAMERAGDDATRTAIDGAVRHTLDRMLAGGIHDQIGGGFHRYSVDAHWTVPHFEKMLYDNAGLAFTYARASELFEDSEYARVARRVCGYVLREMTSEAGAFFSAQDAEVNAREGLSYLWTEAEFRAALDADDAEFATGVLGLSHGTNFQDPHHESEPPSNVPRLADRTDAIAPSMGVGVPEFRDRLDRVSVSLLAVRDRRQQPRLDDKVIAAWNGLMIRGMARAATALGEATFLDAAERASAFVQREMVVDGELQRSWRDGVHSGGAFLEDHAMMVWGLCELAGAQRAAGRDPTGSLRFAERLADRAIGRFVDQESGRAYDVAPDDTELFVRPRSTYDGAMVSPTSSFVSALVSLSAATGEARFRATALDVIAGVSADVAASPASSAEVTRQTLRLLTEGVDLAQELERRGGLSPDREESPSMPSPVEVYANADRVTVGEEPAELGLVLMIDDGYHVVSADPGVPGVSLVPLRVDVVGGSGIAVYADYPAGEPLSLEGDGSIGPLNAYTGQIEMRVAIEKTGEIRGRPILVVSYQACSDDACFEPRSVELDVAIDAG